MEEYEHMFWGFILRRFMPNFILHRYWIVPLYPPHVPLVVHRVSKLRGGECKTQLWKLQWRNALSLATAAHEKHFTDPTIVKYHNEVHDNYRLLFGH